MKLIMFVVFVVVCLIVYILFSDPKPQTDLTMDEGRNSTLYNSCIKNSYPSTREIFKTLKDANIPPTFMGGSVDE